MLKRLNSDVIIMASLPAAGTDPDVEGQEKRYIVLPLEGWA